MSVVLPVFFKVCSKRIYYCFGRSEFFKRNVDRKRPPPTLYINIYKIPEYGKMF